VIAFNLLNDKMYSGYLVALFLFGGLLSFYFFHIKSPFNHPMVSKLWSFLVSVNLWTGIMLTMAQVLFLNFLTN